MEDDLEKDVDEELGDDTSDFDFADDDSDVDEEEEDDSDLDLNEA
jgi:hypothetical protein